MTRIDNASPTNQRMLHNTEPKGSDTKGAVLPLNEDRAYPIPKASAPPERRLFLVALPASSRTPHSRARAPGTARPFGAAQSLQPSELVARGKLLVCAPRQRLALPFACFVKILK